MPQIDKLKELLETNSQNLSQEFKRLFHGRGGLYEGFNFLTIDSIDTILSVAFYFECDKELERNLVKMLKEFIKSTRHDTIILQKRYTKDHNTQVIEGELLQEIYSVENGLKFILNLKSNQNSGYFPDMKLGREYIKSIAKDKNILNLFSYTCGFSLAAISGGAKSVINYDMSKSALNTGRQNHRINNLDTKKVKFHPHNILKSFSKIKKESPYDIIIIDPPTFQKGSFEATNDYVKIIKRLDDISSDDCIVLASLNSPELNSQFIIDLFNANTTKFKFVTKLENLETFKAKTEEKSLKNLIFRRNL